MKSKEEISFDEFEGKQFPIKLAEDVPTKHVSSPQIEFIVQFPTQKEA